MTEFEKLVELEQLGFDNIEVRHKTTSADGVCCTANENQVALWWGAEDGSDDGWISAEEFNDNFRIVACCADDY